MIRIQWVLYLLKIVKFYPGENILTVFDWLVQINDSTLCWVVKEED